MLLRPPRSNPAICAKPYAVVSGVESTRLMPGGCSVPEKPPEGEHGPSVGLETAEYSKPHISTRLTLKSADAASGSLPNVSHRPDEPYSKASSSHRPNWPPPPKAIESANPSWKCVLVPATGRADVAVAVRRGEARQSAGKGGGGRGEAGRGGGKRARPEEGVRAAGAREAGGGRARARPGPAVEAGCCAEEEALAGAEVVRRDVPGGGASHLAIFGAAGGEPLTARTRAPKRPRRRRLSGGAQARQRALRWSREADGARS